MPDSQILENQLNHYWSLYIQGQLSKGDIVGLFLILYDVLFPTKDWLQYTASRQLTTQPIQSFIYPKKKAEFKDHPFFRKVGANETLGSALNHCLFKKETLRSSCGLMHIYANPDSVQILDYIPTPLQILEMQTRGQRCVTLLRTKKWFDYTFDHRRNLRDFVIHDLEHLWQMFENPNLTRAQIQFSQQLWQMNSQGSFDFLTKDPHFSKEFNYIISDMNTHPAHTYVTLKSLLTRQRIKALSLTASWLPPEEELKIQDIMQHFESLTSFS